MAVGTVKWFKLDRGFGYITPSDGSKDVFVNISAVKLAGMQDLSEGQQIKYEIEQHPNGKTAATKLSVV